MLNRKSQVGENKNVKFLIATICHRNKKGQIAETMTWLVATVIIVVMLAASIYLVSGSDFLFGGSRVVEKDKVADLLVTKSLMGFLQSDDGGGKIWDQIKDEKGFPENADFRFENSMIELAETIFPKFYSEGASDPVFWMGIVNRNFLSGFGQSASNEQFKSRNGVKAIDKSGEKVIYNKIKLNNNYLELLVKLK